MHKAWRSKKMKRFLAVLLSLILAAGSLFVTAFAADGKKEKVYPVILLQGYSGPKLFNQDTGEKAWGLDFDKVKEHVLNDYGKELANGAKEYAKGNPDPLVDTLGTILLDVMDPIACNADGSSKYNLDTFPKGAEATRMSTLIANGQEEYIGEKPIMTGFVEKLTQQGVENAADYIFIYTNDWRKGQAQYAKDIDAYIDEVRALTCSDKVDIYGLSFGGQCGASYLYYYGEKAKVHKACLNVPAIGGTNMVGDPLLGNDITLDFPTILQFVEIGFRSENEWEWILEFLSSLTDGYQNLNKIVNLVAQKYIVDYIDKFGSIWDFIPLNVYDEVKARLIKDGYVDPVAAAPLIAASDEFHYNALANMSEGLKRAQKAGTQIAIMSNTGINGVTGTYKNSDYIIDVHTSSGSACAPFGEQFPEDYAPVGTQCNNKKHWHISPDRDIDATCSYLPENTWFIKGQFHGQSNWDSYSREFILEFMFGDSIKDIYSNPKYPQFELAQNPADGLYMRFDNTNSGFHTSEDTALVFTNLSEQYTIDILDISAKGFNLFPEYNSYSGIGAGSTEVISMTDHCFAKSTQPISIKVRYRLNSPQRLIKEKTFTFTHLSDDEIKDYPFINDASKLIIGENEPTPVTETAPADTTENTSENIEERAEVRLSGGENKVSSKIPKTGSAKRGIALSSFAVITAAATAGVIIKKKREEA